MLFKDVLTYKLVFAVPPEEMEENKDNDHEDQVNPKYHC